MARLLLLGAFILSKVADFWAALEPLPGLEELFGILTAG